MSWTLGTACPVTSAAARTTAGQRAAQRRTSSRAVAAAAATTRLGIVLHTVRVRQRVPWSRDLVVTLLVLVRSVMTRALVLALILDSRVVAAGPCFPHLPPLDPLRLTVCIMLHETRRLAAARLWTWLKARLRHWPRRLAALETEATVATWMGGLLPAAGERTDLGARICGRARGNQTWGPAPTKMNVYMVKRRGGASAENRRCLLGDPPLAPVPPGGIRCKWLVAQAHCDPLTCTRRVIVALRAEIAMSRRSSLPLRRRLTLAESGVSLSLMSIANGRTGAGARLVQASLPVAIG